ncbi:polysaccharide pyruvyl transferase family protein [bacterium 19MO04SH03]|uniref:Polysaccharide pyruvyl transferase family protein n=2 Tax=Unclassified Bacteria TaxID=49928 RepID=A0AAU6UUC7_UNCXX
MKNNKVFVLNHCSHNKGDNSVLTYVVKKLISKNNELCLSTSSGEMPEWLNKLIGKKVDSVLWGPGDWFDYKNSKVNYYRLRIKQKIYINLFYYILRKYSQGEKLLVKRIFSLIYNKSFLRKIKDADIVLSSGGHHISSVLDVDGINPQLLDMICADVYGKKLVLWAQSIGPVKTDISYIKKSISLLIKNSLKTFYRCDQSREFLTEIGAIDFDGVSELDDSVFGLIQLLDRENKINISHNSREKKAIVAIYNSSYRDKSEELRYIENLIKIIDKVILSGYRVSFLPMQYKGDPGDERPLISQIINGITNSERVDVIDKDLSPIETLKKVSEYSLLIGHKTHSVVYGLGLEIPTLAIAYHPKTRYFMRRYGVEKYCIDEHEFIENQELSLSLVDDLIENELACHDILNIAGGDIKSRVNDEFDKIFY